MIITKYRPFYILIVLIIILVIIASAGGLFINNLYCENISLRSQWVKNDIVILLAAVPILVVSLYLTMKGSTRALLVMTGIVHYILYNYAFYLFGVMFNKLFLVYTSLFGLSIFSLIYASQKIRANEIRMCANCKTPVKIIGGYMIIIGIVLGGLWIALSLDYVFKGVLPQVVFNSEYPISVMIAIDLTLLVPFLIIGGIWLWKRKPWGYVLGTVLNVSCTIYTLTLTIIVLYADRSIMRNTELLTPVWIALTVLGLIASIIMLKNIEGQK